MTRDQYLRTGIRVAALAFFFFELRIWGPFFATLGSQYASDLSEFQSLSLGLEVLTYFVLLVLPIAIWFFPGLIMPKLDPASKIEHQTEHTESYRSLHYTLISVMGLWLLVTGGLWFLDDMIQFTHLAIKEGPSELIRQSQRYWETLAYALRLAVGLFLTFRTQELVDKLRQWQGLQDLTPKYPPASRPQTRR